MGLFMGAWNYGSKTKVLPHYLVLIFLYIFAETNN